MKFYLYEKILIAIAGFVLIITIPGIVLDESVEIIRAKLYASLNYLIFENPIVLVAICALWATIWQGLAIRKHNRLSVRPLLVLNTDRGNKDRTVEISIINSGSGLAFIEKFVLYYNGEEISCNDNDAYEDFLDNKLKELEPHYTTTQTGHFGFDGIIKVDQEQVLWAGEYSVKAGGTILNRLHFYIEYKSIYREQDETFIADTRGSKDFYKKPKFVFQCPPSPKD